MSRHQPRPSSRFLIVVVASIVAVAGSSFGPRQSVAEATSGFEALPEPRRLLDTRPGHDTYDGLHSGVGTRLAGTTYELEVSGRAGLSFTADVVALNITAIARSDPGYITAFRCGTDRPATSNVNYLPGDVVATLAIVPIGPTGRVCLFTYGRADLAVDAIGTFESGDIEILSPASRLLDTRPGHPTVDGQFDDRGPYARGETGVVTIGGRAGLPPTPGPTVLTLTAVGRAPGFVTVWACGDDRPDTSNINFVAGQFVANTAIVDFTSSGFLCIYAGGAVDLIVDVIGRFDAGSIGVLPEAARLLDTRPPRSTNDGEYAGIGPRTGHGTLQLPVAGRGGVPDGAGAAIVNLVTTQSRAAGFVTAHPPAESTPTASNLNHDPGQTISNLAIVPLDASGNVCLFNRADTHLVVDVVAHIPVPARAAVHPECPAQRLFPHWRMVGLYGTDRAAVLGALGEQDPDAAAERLRAVTAPWRRPGDRPVLPAFDLIATIATAAPGPSGLYRSRSSDEQIQRYLDAARRHGVYLILDLQPGRSDFLTEAKAYERFLREPDVGVALDPEWRTEYPATPGGGYVGHVDASEVNAVADWLAGLVAEEGLPEKLLVVHQFQIQMIRDKHLLREPEGIALNIHMDGFGTRTEKLTTYSFVHVDEPWSNGFKLFYDEDINIFTADDILGGAAQPIPDLITYQ
jgi:hypothetical protein